jgi:hypothetical protein
MSESKQALKGKLRGKRLRGKRAGGDGQEFPFQLCKVTLVDSVRHIISLYALSGSGNTYENVGLTQPGAGARHFLGSMPEVGDLCVVGFAQAESGFSRTPYVVGWVVLGPQAGTDWLTTSPTSEEELNLTPSMRTALEGSFGRRRHKLRQIEKGNVMGSSSQGSDMILNESVLLANRRGNEIWLRDQDQALVIRTLQQFHAGAGFRVYGGMVQRDATLLPTQMFGDYVDWAAERQLDSSGKPISSSELTEADESDGLTPAEVFGQGLAMGCLDPLRILKRGLFIDETGAVYDDLVKPTAVYGGKPLYRVSVDSENAVLDEDTDVFTEYRIEVAHTTDGTLPVTEQTDGIDIDRLLPSAPTPGADGTGDVNPLNRSQNSPMVEWVLGTAIGNDPIGDRESYGQPLVARLYDNNGRFSPGVSAAEEGTPVTEHSAFLIRVRNPIDPKAPEAFMAITKGGTFRSYFPGTGSKSHQEYYQTGKQVSLGQDADGMSQVIEADGTISLRNIGKGRSSDNVGVDIRSENGAVSIFGGGFSSAGAGSPSSNPNGTPANGRVSLLLQSAQSLHIRATETARIAAQEISLEEADSIRLTANSALAINSGENVSVSTKVLGVTVNGKAEYTFGGPKDALPTNGPSRTTTFGGTPLTGAIGGVMDAYEMVYGNREETFRLGKHETVVNVGSYNVYTMGVAPVSVGPGSGVHLATGVPGLRNELELGVTGAKLTAGVGGVTVQATAGSATLRGSVSAKVQSALQVSLAAPFVKVSTPTPFTGGVLTDGCLNSLTGRSYFLSGSLGVATFRVG